MGRRAVRRIDPSIDLTRHLATLDQLAAPLDAAALFGRRAPLEVEIGSGKGLFLLGAALARPEHDFLGCEISHKYARFAAARLARRNLPNARMLDADALRLFREFLPDGAAHAVHVYFPDPWWKKRHRKRRVMNEPLLRDIERVLAPGGTLHFWTDVQEYFHESLALLAAVTRLAGPFDVPEAAPAHDLDFRTNFERKKRQAGAAIYRAEFRRPPQ